MHRDTRQLSSLQRVQHAYSYALFGIVRSVRHRPQLLLAHAAAVTLLLLCAATDQSMECPFSSKHHCA